MSARGQRFAPRVGITVDDIKRGAEALVHAAPAVQARAQDFGRIPAEVHQAEQQLVEIKMIALGALALGGIYVVARIVGGR